MLTDTLWATYPRAFFIERKMAVGRAAHDQQCYIHVPPLLRLNVYLLALNPRNEPVLSQVEGLRG